MTEKKNSQRGSICCYVLSYVWTWKSDK